MPLLFPLRLFNSVLGHLLKTANVSCYLLLFYLLSFQPVVSHFSLCYPRRTGLLQWCLLKWGIFTDQGEALSTLVQSSPRATEMLWWTVHPGKQEIFSEERSFWTEELLSQQSSAVGWQLLICATGWKHLFLCVPPLTKQHMWRIQTGWWIPASSQLSP